MPTLPDLFDHLIWADARVRRSLAAIDAARPERAEAERLYAHLAAAQHVWLTRVEGSPPQHPVWPQLAWPEAVELARTTAERLCAIAAADEPALARKVSYRTSAGQLCTDSVRDILLQVALHGVHHRGQIAQLVRRAGGVPEPIDYIVFVRTRGAVR